MRIVDFHNHYFPPAYLAAIRTGPSNFEVSDDADGNPVLHSPGDYNVVVPGHRDIDHRAEVIAAVGVDTQVITFTAPGTSIEEPERAVQLARLVNDSLAEVVATSGGQFASLATLPMNNPQGAVHEVDRAFDQLGFRGVMLFSNASGVPLADPRFEPLYARLDAHGAVVYIHPTYPLGVEAMHEYMLMPLVGFPMDTTLAAAHLVFAGVPERYPDIRWALGHLGGAIPYLAERLDRGYAAFEPCRRALSRRPSEVLREFYYDTVNFDPAALRMALDFAGADHILAGSDYPHMIGSLESMLSSIRSLDLEPADEAKILGGNAARLLGLV